MNPITDQTTYNALVAFAPAIIETIRYQISFGIKLPRIAEIFGGAHGQIALAAARHIVATTPNRRRRDEADEDEDGD